MAGFFSKVSNPNVTTMQKARQRSPGLATISTTKHNKESEEILAGKAEAAIKNLPPALASKLRQMQAAGQIPSKELIDEAKSYLLDGNRFPNGEIELLGREDYFAITPFTPEIEGQPWGQDQIIAHDAAQIRDIMDEGNTALSDNKTNPGMSTAMVGLPAAGSASRAATYAQEHPGLVARLKSLGGLDGLGKDQMPPRFLYPIKTNDGIKSLIGLMLSASEQIGKDLSASIPSTLMLHPGFAEFVINKLESEFQHKSGNDFDNIALFSQSMSRRMYLSDQTLLSNLDPTGHGDFPNSLARYSLFDHMVENGTKYFVFSNADEIMWSPNPLVIGTAQRLFNRGYKRVDFVVPNTNNQSGGGPVKQVSDPLIKFLCEMTCMAKDQMIPGKYPFGINTTFMVMLAKSLAQKNENLLSLNPALDLKTTTGRNGGSELALTLESWAGSEFTKPTGDSENDKTAFIFAPRVGFFTGVKTLEQSHSDTIPAELIGNPTYGRMTYQKYMQHLATIYPRILKMMVDSDANLAHKLFESGGSYLINV